MLECKWLEMEGHTAVGPVSCELSESVMKLPGLRQIKKLPLAAALCGTKVVGVGIAPSAQMAVRAPYNLRIGTYESIAGPVL